MNSAKTQDTNIENPINFKIVALLIGIAIAYLVITQLIVANDGMVLVENCEEGFWCSYFEYTLTVLYGVAAAAAILTAKKYWGSEVFGKAYLALGIGFASVFVAEIIWYVLEWLGHDTFPAISDLFYFMLYPFTMYHLIKNCKYFKDSWNSLTKFFLIAFPIFIVVIYSLFYIDEYGIEALAANEDDALIWFIYTLIFVAGAANTTTFAVVGILVFRKSTLASAWALLAGSIFINDIGDFWYYYVEQTEGWDPLHPTFAMWILSLTLAIYSLYKHQKII